jgi:hypothetical protein
MFKGGLLAWKLCSKSLVVRSVASHRGNVSLWGCVGVGLYRERRGGRADKYTANICNTEHAIL